MRSERLRLAVVGTLLLLIITVAIYAGVVPMITADQYAGKVQGAAKPLEESFRAIGESTELALLTDPEAPEPVRRDNETHIKGLIDESRQRLTALKSASNSFSPLPYSNILGQYRRAEVLREHAQMLIGQSEAVLDEYLAVVAYLKVFDKAMSDARLELDTFNKVTDLNAYGGQSDRLRQIATKIRLNSTSLSESMPPDSSTKALNMAAIAALNEAADGFDDLANGLEVPADDPIYTAARKIEAATARVGEVAGKTYDSSLEQSRALKDVRDLSEKLELVWSV